MRPGPVALSRRPLFRGMALFSAMTFALVACGAPAASPAAPPAGATPGDESPAETAGEVPTVTVRLNPSQVATAVAQEEGLFENLNVDYTRVGYGESAPLFLANDDPIGFESPWEVARFRSEGENISYFGTAAALNFWNGVIIRAEDADTYQSIEDLVGKKLGHPGFGTGTWQAFEIIAQAVNGIDAQSEFELVQADPGALLGLLETGEIDAALNFAGQAATAMASDDFELLYSFTTAWQEAEGQPLIINGIIGRRDWLEENTDAACRFLEGTDRGVQWMKDNPEEFMPGGKYADWVEGEGWFSSEETNEFIVDLLEDGEWYFTQDLYTDEWVNSVYEFVQQGEGVFAEEVPPMEEVFFMPDELSC